MMKKRVILNYASAFGLPSERPDAGLALIHLLESEHIQLDAILISGSAADLPRISAALGWLLKFSGRTDIRVFGSCAPADEAAAGRAEQSAADSLKSYLDDTREAEGKPVLLDLGEPSALILTVEKMQKLSDYFTEIVFWTPQPHPSQRRGLSLPHGSLQDEALRTLYMDSDCILTMFGEEPGYQTPLDIDELVTIRNFSRPLYYLLKDYLLCTAVSEGRGGGQDFLFRLPAAVYLTNPELFYIKKKMMRPELNQESGFSFSDDGRAVMLCEYISDIKEYNRSLQAIWKSWHGQGGAR
ncbi:MAG: hypothetical protein JEZ04_08025 [Spirochaetales bacterium]|nr:hypothetical protein [Spirochaetales bacterium]